MEKFVFKTNKEVKEMQLPEFLVYAVAFNEELKKKNPLTIDQHLCVKFMEDYWIAFTMRTMLKYNVLGFNFQHNKFNVVCSDESWEEKEVTIANITSNIDNTYTIRDDKYQRVPFSFIKDTGIVLQQLVYKCNDYFNVKESTIYNNQ